MTSGILGLTFWAVKRERRRLELPQVAAFYNWDLVEARCMYIYVYNVMGAGINVSAVEAVSQVPNVLWQDTLRLWLVGGIVWSVRAQAAPDAAEAERGAFYMQQITDRSGWKWQASLTRQEVVKLPLEFVRQLSIKVQHQRPGKTVFFIFSIRFWIDFFWYFVCLMTDYKATDRKRQHK